MAREDRRQWDKEIRDAYVAIAKHVNEIDDFRYRAIPDEARQARYETGASALDQIRTQADLLRIIGTKALINRVEDLESACSHIVATWHDQTNPGKGAYRALYGARGELLNTVKSEIRVEQYKPFVRPPMSRLTRLKVAAAVKLQALRRAIRK